MLPNFKILALFWRQFYSIASKTGMSNVRPAGRMRPANGFNAARETFSKCAYIKEKIFFERLFFLEMKFSIMQSGPRENRFTPCGPWAEMSLTPLL